MRRLSPITICLVGLAAMMLTAVAYLISRAPTDPAPVASTPEEPAAMTPPSPQPRSPLRATEPEPSPAPRRLAIEVPTPAPLGGLPSQADLDAGTPPNPPLSPISRRRLLVAADRYRVLDQVDEGVFETLKLAEGARAAIRRLNDDHKKKAQALLSSPDAGAGTSLDAAEAARREAIDTVLGKDAAKDFHAAEFAATRRLRRQGRLPPPGEPGATATTPAQDPATQTTPASTPAVPEPVTPAPGTPAPGTPVPGTPAPATPAPAEAAPGPVPANDSD